MSKKEIFVALIVFNQFNASSKLYAFYTQIEQFAYNKDLMKIFKYIFLSYKKYLQNKKLISIIIKKQNIFGKKENKNIYYNYPTLC